MASGALWYGSNYSPTTSGALSCKLDRVSSWRGRVPVRLDRHRGAVQFAAAAVLSLALGIGANSAIFSLLDQTLWRPLPAKDPQELVLLYQPGLLQGHTNIDEPDGPSLSAIPVTLTFRVAAP